MPSRKFRVEKVIKACEEKIRQREKDVEEHRERQIQDAMTYTEGRWWWKLPRMRTREEAIDYLKNTICDYYLISYWDSVETWFPIGKTKKLLEMCKANSGDPFITLDQKEYEMIAQYLEHAP